MAEANVKNLEAIDILINSIGKMRHETRKQIDEIRQQFQRVSTWLEKELPEYWSNEKRIAETRWVEAREELLRCTAKTRAEDETSCSVQRKMLRKATERLTLCEERLRLVPRCAMQWNQFLQEVTTDVRQVDDLAESSLLNAGTRLQATLETLKKYANL
jgi:hypothetical protein